MFVGGVLLGGGLAGVAGLALGHDRLLDLVRYGLLGGRPYDDDPPRTAGSVMLTQTRSWYTPDMPPFDRNGFCAPTSALMGVRLLGHDLPGLAGGHSRHDVEAAAAIAHGGTLPADRTRGTTLDQVARVADAAGIGWHVEASFDAQVAAVEAGSPVVLTGSGSRSPSFVLLGVGGPRLGSNPGGRHAVLVASYERADDRYVVLDPSALSGPLRLTRDELSAFSDGAGLVLERPADEARGR